MPFIQVTVRMFVSSKASSREVAQTMGVHQSTVVRWTQELGNRCIAPPQANDQLHPTWRGIIGIDGKIISVGGHPMVFLIATDIPTVDIPHWDLVPAEDEAGCRRFLEGLRDRVFPLHGIVSDLGKGRVWIKLVAELFPDVPHQACIVHFGRYVQQTLPQSKKHPHYEENQLLRQLIRDLLYATNFNDAEEIFLRLMRADVYFKADFQRTVLRSLRKHFDLLTAHFHTPALDSTNNVTENIIKQLDRKVFLLSDFATEAAASNFLKLWVYHYRFKPLAASNYEFRNGLSPLQLAGVDTSRMEWLNFALKTRS